SSIAKPLYTVILSFSDTIMIGVSLKFQTVLCSSSLFIGFSKNKMSGLLSKQKIALGDHFLESSNNRTTRLGKATFVFQSLSDNLIKESSLLISKSENS